jgi:hypothetical protein
MQISNFDPYEVLQNHESVINDLVQAHNDVARLQEELAATVVKLNNRVEYLERILYETK